MAHLIERDGVTYCVEEGGYEWEYAPATSTLTLDEYKKLKLDELNAACEQALRTFQSSALGTVHTYLSETDDMLLLNGEYSYVKGDDYDGLPIKWYTVEAGNVDHTKAQFVQVYLDGRRNVATNKYHRAALEAQVTAATDRAGVNAVVW